MYRSHDCGALRLNHQGTSVVLCGWVQKVRDKGGIIWIDLRDRFGVTQVVLEEGVEESSLLQIAREVGREFVLQVEGKVAERHAKNVNIPTGEIEVRATKIKVLNKAKTPPFTIENETDGGEEVRMAYRYLDIRRNRNPLSNQVHT